MKNVNSKIKLNGLEEYKTTLILFTILLVVMSLIAFLPLNGNKTANNNNGYTNNAK